MWRFHLTAESNAPTCTLSKDCHIRNASLQQGWGHRARTRRSTVDVERMARFKDTPCQFLRQRDVWQHSECHKTGSDLTCLNVQRDDYSLCVCMAWGSTPYSIGRAIVIPVNHQLNPGMGEGCWVNLGYCKTRNGRHNLPFFALGTDALLTEERSRPHSGSDLGSHSCRLSGVAKKPRAVLFNSHFKLFAPKTNQTHVVWWRTPETAGVCLYLRVRLVAG